MSDDIHTFAAAVVQSPRWRWMPGMLADYAAGMVARPVRLTDDRHPSYPDEYDWPHDLGLRVPDLTDPATLGCLLALVREAWGDPTAACSGGHLSLEWRCNLIQSADGFRYLRGFDGASEPAALVAALLAAPPPAR